MFALDSKVLKCVKAELEDEKEILEKKNNTLLALLKDPKGDV